jgi:hypothetical protein
VLLVRGISLHGQGTINGGPSYNDTDGENDRLHVQKFTSWDICIDRYITKIASPFLHESTAHKSSLENSMPLINQREGI